MKTETRHMLAVSTILVYCNLFLIIVFYDFAYSVINMSYATTIQTIQNFTRAHFKLHYLILPNVRAIYSTLYTYITRC
jgi:hypothetical protein